MIDASLLRVISQVFAHLDEYAMQCDSLIRDIMSSQSYESSRSDQAIGDLFDLMGSEYPEKLMYEIATVATIQCAAFRSDPAWKKAWSVTSQTMLTFDDDRMSDIRLSCIQHLEPLVRIPWVDSRLVVETARTSVSRLESSTAFTSLNDERGVRLMKVTVAVNSVQKELMRLISPDVD